MRQVSGGQTEFVDNAQISKDFALWLKPIDSATQVTLVRDEVEVPVSDNVIEFMELLGYTYASCISRAAHTNGWLVQHGLRVPAAWLANEHRTQWSDH